MSSATRLLVLGAIRIMQPVHGYDVRRELLSWRLEEIANVKPGSIYGALRTLLKDGCVAVHSQQSDDNRPEKTSYVTTGEGEKEFQLLLREAWWTVRAGVAPLVPALTLMVFMPREELIRALGARIARLEANTDAASFARASIRDGATGADGAIPEHVREIYDFLALRTRAEIDWAKAFQKRLRAGAYRFAGEHGMPDIAPGRGYDRRSEL
ncbi:MAG: PadR family transcriptional regulator [Jatrophihabitans sp.]